MKYLNHKMNHEDFKYSIYFNFFINFKFYKYGNNLIIF